MAAILLTMCFPAGASACSLMYVGGDYTDDGANAFMRTEEVYADSNTIYYVSPADNHKKGETYKGCYGFTWKFTHDSYEYTARRDDNLSGVCPDCDGTHKHTPYEETGTNDHGVTVSATQSLAANPKIEIEDPFTEDGISEAEMATILLSEASSAREGVELLLSFRANKYSIFYYLVVYGKISTTTAVRNVPAREVSCSSLPHGFLWFFYNRLCQEVLL